uniref:Flavin-containing monooxygenase n=1 Tax=Amphora coffeiformis TaxID=265554 RepID=A0A7S3L9I6_9STRA|mmetsp:Transcript_1705/g.3708  ORF Transcript_1705/g.3708 Transcript_1705/m.3708 type:complete len:487 (+) Transcript_1705:77-1537(+)
MHVFKSRWWSYYTLLLVSAFVLKSSTMAFTQALHENSPKIAVIGAGAAGLAIARVMQRAGLDQVLVLEKDTSIGGVWNYKEAAKDRPMYQGLRTNLPKEIMGYREYPFPKEFDKSFLTHRQVCQYLKGYRDHFNLSVQYGCAVNKLKVLEGEESCVNHSSGDKPWPKIELEWTDGPNQQEKKDVFDAVYIANGHYSQPQVPPIPGIEHFKGKTIHSIEYDLPSDFKGQKILCIGGRASGADLAREMTEAGAARVFLSDSAKKDGNVETLGDTLTWVPRTNAIRKDGTLEFDLGCEIHPEVDVIIFCTGYDYNFPFIGETSNLPLDSRNRRVQPLFEQLWHAVYPNIAFIGLPHSVVPFPLFELQAEACLSQMTRCTLPDLTERMEHAVKAVGGEGMENGRVEDTHYLGSKQWDYCRRMAKYGGVYDESLEAFLTTNQKIYDHTGGLRKDEFPAGPDTYREYVYERDDANSSFRIVETPVESTATVG